MALTVKHLSAKAGEFRLDVPSLEIEPGEIVGLLGKSGSGKSTLLAALGGFVPVTGGEIWIEGENRSAFYPERRRLAYVFQKSTLFPHMTVARNVAFPLEVAGRPKAEREAAIAPWLERLGIAALKDRRPENISGGEAQRAAIARALVSGFKVLLLDEPFSALDPKLRRELRSLVKELVTEAKLSVLWVSHDLEDTAVFTRVTVLEAGRVAWQGPAPELPRDRFF